jgi:hypothetical protein
MLGNEEVVVRGNEVLPVNSHVQHRVSQLLVS